jgi:nucleotide-binding universal stress UspA family protein
MIALRNVLVATDFGEPAAAAFSYARELAQAFDATLHIVHVAEPFDAQLVGFPVRLPSLARLHEKLQDDARARMQALVATADHGLRTRIVVLSSPWPALAIVDYARTAHVDLIVLGTHGHGRIGELVLGSVAAKVVRHAPCPVLTTRRLQPSVAEADAAEPAAQRARESRPRGTQHAGV